MKKTMKMVVAVATAVVTAATVSANAFAFNFRSEVASHVTTVSPYMSGYANGTVKPNGTITRAEMASILYNALGAFDYRTTDKNYSLTPLTEVTDEEAYINRCSDGVHYSDAQFGNSLGTATDYGTYIPGNPYANEVVYNQYWYGKQFATLFPLRLFQETFSIYMTQAGDGAQNAEQLFDAMYDSLQMDKFPMGPQTPVATKYSKVISATSAKKLAKLQSYGFLNGYTTTNVWYDNYNSYKTVYITEIDNGCDPICDYNVCQLGLQAAYNKLIDTLYPNGLQNDNYTHEDVIEYDCNVTVMHMIKARPTEKLTRKDLAIALYRITDKSETSIDKTFTDTTSLSKEAQQAISMLSGAGVVTGYEDGSFRPNATVTRAEAVCMVNRFFGDHIKSSTRTSVPSDLKGHWAESEIMKVLK